MLGGADNPNGELPSYITGADINARPLDFPRRFSAIQFLPVHICQRLVAYYQGMQRAFKRVMRFPGCRALLTTELCQHAASTVSVLLRSPSL